MSDILRMATVRAKGRLSVYNPVSEAMRFKVPSRNHSVSVFKLQKSMKMNTHIANINLIGQQGEGVL